MKRFDYKEILVPAVALLIICGVVTALLAVTNRLTDAHLQALTAQSEDETRRGVLPEAVKFTEVNDTRQYYIGLAEDGLTRVGYVFITEAKGYGGTIRVMTGIADGASDGQGKVTGVALLAHEETPGLGANAADSAFTDQFRQDITGATGFALYGADMGIDAITGATVTSNAVIEAVNLALADYRHIAEEVEAR